MAKPIDEDGVEHEIDGCLGHTHKQVKNLTKCTPGALHEKSIHAKKAFDDEKALLCDEVHKASTESSATGNNLQTAMRASEKVVAASATAVKNPRYVKYLSFLFDEYTDMNEYQKLLQKGGEAMQEVWAELLSKAGFMRRIENDNSNNIHNEKAEDSRERNMAIQTALAPIYSAMAQLSGEMNSIVTNQENELQETERVANAVIDAAGG